MLQGDLLSLDAQVVQLGHAFEHRLHCNIQGGCYICSEMVGLAPKLVRLDPKLDKSGTFSNQISVHLAIGPQIGQIRDFFRSDFSTFGSLSQMY